MEGKGGKDDQSMGNFVSQSESLDSYGQKTQIEWNVEDGDSDGRETHTQQTILVSWRTKKEGIGIGEAHGWKQRPGKRPIQQIINDDHKSGQTSRETKRNDERDGGRRRRMPCTSQPSWSPSELWSWSDPQEHQDNIHTLPDPPTGSRWPTLNRPQFILWLLLQLVCSWLKFRIIIILKTILPRPCAPSLSPFHRWNWKEGQAIRIEREFDEWSESWGVDDQVTHLNACTRSRLVVKECRNEMGKWQQTKSRVGCLHEN